MVQEYSAPVRVFKYPFELVMAAYERRFPTCHLIPVFVGSDKIYENISEDGAIQVIERRCQIAVDAPYLLRKITGVDHILFIQKNTLDRRKRVLKIEAWNESFSNHISIQELCHYRVCSENESWTIFEQQASLEIKSFFGFEQIVEKLAVKHYSQNIKKGEEIIEYHIKELADEGITHVPLFNENTSKNSKLIIATGDIETNDNISIQNEQNNKLNGTLDVFRNSTTTSKNHNHSSLNGSTTKITATSNETLSNQNSIDEKHSSSTKLLDFRSNSIEDSKTVQKSKFLSKSNNKSNENLKKKNTNHEENKKNSTSIKENKQFSNNSVSFS